MPEDATKGAKSTARVGLLNCSSTDREGRDTDQRPGKKEGQVTPGPDNGSPAGAGHSQQPAAVQGAGLPSAKAADCVGARGSRTHFSFPPAFCILSTSERTHFTSNSLHPNTAKYNCAKLHRTHF